MAAHSSIPAAHHSSSCRPQTLSPVGVWGTIWRAFPHDGARLLAHTHAMLLFAPIDSQIIPCHRSLLGQSLPQRPNDSLALYRSSGGRLPIERCSPFLAWGGRSVLAPLEGVGFVGPRPSKRQGYMIMNEKQNGITNDSRGLYKAPRVCAPPVSANRAGDPKGHTTANMVLGPFTETKGPRPPGRNPATANTRLDAVVG